MLEHAIKAIRAARSALIERVFVNLQDVKLGIASFLSSLSSESLNKRTRLSAALAGTTGERVIL